MPTILVVDDDRSVLDLTKKFLGSHGYGVVVADNGSEALLLVKEAAPDLVLCDAKMPGLDGRGLLRMLKNGAGTRGLPVVMMSGERIDDTDVVGGLGDGADDYVLKPFSLPVLLARLEAVLRRFAPEKAAGETLKRCGIELDAAARTVKSGREPVTLTRKEFDLLAALLSRPGRVHSVTSLLQSVWGYDPADYNDPSTVEVHVSHLRRKLGARGRHVVNVLGHGYKFDEAA